MADKSKVKGHRIDNSEWGKRMERQLGQIERRQQTKVGASTPHVIPFIPCIQLMSEREADEMAQNGEVLTWRFDQNKLPELFVKGHGNLGKIVATFF